MERNRQLLRVLLILHDLLSPGASVTVKELALRYRVHPKTIRRDLRAIEESPFRLGSIIEKGERRFFISLAAK